MWAAIFQKSYKTPILYRKSLPPKQKQTQTKLPEQMRCDLNSFQCKDRHHTDKSDVLTPTLQ